MVVSINKFKSENPEDGARLEGFQKGNSEAFNLLHGDLGMTLDEISKAGKEGNIENYPKEGEKPLDKKKEKAEDEDNDEYSDDEYKADCESYNKMKADLDGLSAKINKRKDKKEKSEKDSDFMKAEDIEKSEIFKSLKQENEDLQKENSDIKKSVNGLMGAVEDLKKEVKGFGDQVLQKSTLPSVSFFEKSNEMGVKVSEEGQTSLSLTRNREAVINLLDGEIQKAEGSEKEDLRNSLINFSAGGGGVPSERTAMYLHSKKNVLLEK